MTVLTNPLFWALVSLLALQGGAVVLSGHAVGRNFLFVTVVLTLVTVGRILLVLPFCPQPRFDLGLWQWVIGGAILLLALLVALPALSIQWWRAPEAGMELRTTSVYAVVRHPLYLAEVLWPIGWSFCWGSHYGLALTVVWWLGFLMHALIEETHLEHELGSEYAEYMRKVRGRILPGLPV